MPLRGGQTSTFSGPSKDGVAVGGGGGVGSRGGADRWRNPFRDINKIKEADMIKHEVQDKGNVNLNPILSLSKTASGAPQQVAQRIYEADFLNLIEGFRCY